MTDSVEGQSCPEPVPSITSESESPKELPSRGHRGIGIIKWLLGATVCLVVLVGVGLALGWLDPLADFVSPRLTEVTGQVLYNGKPLTSGFVQTFYEPGGRMGALGPLDAEGKFRLMTNGEPGAFSGHHRAIVLYMDGSFPPKSLLPDCYGQPQTSPLFIDVSRSGPNEVQLKLVDPEST